MKLEDLIGAEVWVKQASGPEHHGTIRTITKLVEAANIMDSISVSTFKINLDSGGVLETSGFNITGINKEGWPPRIE
jgi:hypothetical protein